MRIAQVTRNSGVLTKLVGEPQESKLESIQITSNSDAA